jgi:hypothetical protein
MSKDLTNSQIDRQNILSNPCALAEVETPVGINGNSFESRSVLPEKQVAAFLAIKTRTVDNDFENSADEPRQNGHALICGKLLQQLKLSRQVTFGHEAHFVTKTTIPRMLDFPAVRSRRKKAAQLALAKEHP